MALLAGHVAATRGPLVVMGVGVGGLIDLAVRFLSGQLFERAAALAFPEDPDHGGGMSAPGIVISKISPAARPH